MPERPLLLTGPPAVGKSSVARLLADQFPPCAVVEVDDLRRMVVAGEAAPWGQDEGARQTELGARNACLLMSSFKHAGFSVVASDVLLADAGAVYKACNLRPLIVHITATLTATEQRAATRTVYLSEEEFRRLYSTERGAVYADVQVDATDLSLDALTARVADLWALSVPSQRSTGISRPPGSSWRMAARMAAWKIPLLSAWH